MGATPFASLLPETVGASAPESGSPQPPVLLDTGSISGNLLVLAASLAAAQQQSRAQLGQMGDHLHEMAGHLSSLVEGSTQFYAALGVKPGEPATPPTFTSIIHDQSIDKIVKSFSDTLQPQFAAQSAATAALHQRVEHLAQRVEQLCGQPIGEEAVSEVVATVTRDRMGELHAVVEELRVQVRGLLASGGPGGRGSGEPHPPSPSPANRRR